MHAFLDVILLSWGWRFAILLSLGLAVVLHLAGRWRLRRPGGKQLVPPWRPVAAFVRQRTPEFRKEAFGPDCFHLLVGLCWLGGLYVGPSYLVAHQWRAAAVCGLIVLVGSVILATTWRRRLPPAGEEPELAAVPAAPGEKPEVRAWAA